MAEVLYYKLFKILKSMPFFKMMDAIFDYTYSAVLQAENALLTVQNAISDAADYIRYDDGFFATTARNINKGVSYVTSIPADAAKGIFKGSYYLTGRALGKSKQDLDSGLEWANNKIEQKIDQTMNYLSEKGVNTRFIQDSVSFIQNVSNYNSFFSLSKKGLKEYKAVTTEAKIRYKNQIKDQAIKNYKNSIEQINKSLENLEKAKNNQIKAYQNEARTRIENIPKNKSSEYRKERIKKIKQKVEEKKRLNNKIYRHHRQEAIAKKNVANRDKISQLQQIQKENPSIQNSSFRRVLFNETKKAISNGVSSLMTRTYNLFSAVKDNTMSYISSKFFNRSTSYGTHICPYGCGRPIPNAFKGCRELLAAYPDYF